jgi:MFS family permease
MAGGGKDAAFMQAIIIGLTNVVMTVVAMFLIDRLGRKPLLLIGSTGITLSLLLVGFAFMNANYTIDDKSLQNINEEIAGMETTIGSSVITAQLAPLKDKVFDKETVFFSEVKMAIGQEAYNQAKEVVLKNAISIKSIWVLVGLILYVASFAISLGPVMWALLSEIFPNKLRGLAISIVGFWNSIVSFTVASIFPMELEILGSSFTYYIFAGFGFFTLLFVIRFIPETKGKSLEELEEILVNN